MQIKYSYRDAPTILAFSDSNAFIRGLMGPFRSGKSSGCIVEIIKRGMAQKAGPDGIRRSRWLVVRNTYGQLRDTTIKTFHMWFPPAIFGDWRATEHTYKITAFEKCEIEVLFRALDRPDHVSNLLSLEVTGAYVNEAREVPWAIIDALQGRVGQYPSKMQGGCTWAGVFMDTNPPDVDSKWYKFFEETKNPDSFAQIFKQPSGLSKEAENIVHLNGGRAYYERLSVGKDSEWKKVYIHGEYGYVIDGKPIYPEYNDSFHCVECATIDDVPVYRGWDWGLTPACVFCQLAPNGQFIVVDELCADDMGVDSFTDEVLTHSSLYFPNTEFIDIGDPAGLARSPTDERTCFQILNSKGIDIEPGEQNPVLRWESVRKPLTKLAGKGQPGFLLHPRCLRLRKGFQGAYHFRRLLVSADRYSDKPEKNIYSHPHDGLQYVCTRIFGGGLTTPKARHEDDDFADDGYSSRSGVTGY
jgi:hypothetical protein